jgi:hypothetical protein
MITKKEELPHVASTADKKLEYQTTWKLILFDLI